MTQQGRNLIGNALIYFGYAVVVIVFLFPMLWVVSLSLRPLAELFTFPPALLPRHPTLDNYAYVLQNSPIITYLLNSVGFAVATVIGGLLVAVPSAYALSRIRFRSPLVKQCVMLGILAVQLVSPLITVLPLYRYFSALGLIDSRVTVSLVYIAISAPFATWMLKGFLDTVPSALDEAARIDGCTRLQTVTKVLLPVLLPGLASTAILLAISTWAEFLVPFILLSKNELYPISVGILQFESTTAAVSTHKLAAAAFLSAIPAILIFLVLQRFIIGALISGAVKG